jgi:NIMA (never in mitosis gene a)-related kinase
MKKSIKSKSDSKYIGNYQIIKKIGEGSYAKIYKVKKDNSDTLYVLKNIPVSEEDYSSMNEILNESSILSHCDNVYIIKYYDSFFYNGTFNIITEFCPYGDLFGYIKFYKVRGSRIEEKIIWIIFIQLSLGLGYLHHKKILHRDIKTKNIFIKNNLTVKIGDFGIAKILSSTSSYAHTFIGTPYYISPELCKDQPYNDKSDVWALGCVLYELCTLNHPFEGGTQVEIYEKILTQKFKSINPEYSSELKKMIDLLLEKDERKRPKMKDILKMKSVIDRAKKYNIELDTYDTIEEESSNSNSNYNFKNKNKSENIEIESKIINKSNYSNYKNGISNNNNNKDVLKNSSGKKDNNEKSPESYSSKSKKNKFENENKSNKLRIDNIIKNQIKQKPSKNKSTLNKLSSLLVTKNKSLSNIQEDESSFNSPISQQKLGNNNQPLQYIRQFRDIINVDKLNNNNKIKFSSPNEINIKKRDNYNSKGKAKSIQNSNIIQTGKIMNKSDKEKSDINSQKEISIESSIAYNSENGNKKNSEYNIVLNKNNSHNYNISSNIKNISDVNYSSNNQNNYYYYKKEAILKKQQQQRSYLNKKDKDHTDINKIKYNQKYSNFISKSKTTELIPESKSPKISISEDKETIKENENYLSDENSNDNNDGMSNGVNNKIFIPSPFRSGNKSTNNLKEFTLEKIPVQKLNNSFTIEQSKEHVKMYIESNNMLNDKPEDELISENKKLQKLKEDTIKKIKKNESEMKSISYGVYQHVINMYKDIEAGNKDITELTDSLQKYMRQNLIIKDDKESEKLYKTFKKSFFNYILCEVELNNVENQIEKRKIIGKWDLNQNYDNNNKNKININTTNDDFDKVYGKPKNIYKK